MLASISRCRASLRVLSAPVSRPLSRQINPSGNAWQRAIAPSRLAAAHLHASAQRYQTEAVASESDAADSSAPPPPPGLITRFHELDTHKIVHTNVVATIVNRMKLDTMTDVQSKTINVALSGVDLIAQAKTGTGKTLAFLLPIVQNVLKQQPHLANRGYHKVRMDDTCALIISPTRELAEQIAAEARRLTSATGIVVQTAVGGTAKHAGLQRIRREGCHLLVGTPGRLNDLLTDEYSGVRAPHLNTLVLDEADRLLDAGFQKELDSIIDQLPRPMERDRQTMMFSATMAREVIGLVRENLKQGFHYVKCVDDNEQPTHERVPQRLIELNGLENAFPTLVELFESKAQEARSTGARPFKAIVYFNSTAEVTIAQQAFLNITRLRGRTDALARIESFEIHSRLTQAGRTKASDRFRRAESAVLFSSDVTARGMDFPNVTHVIQVGVPRQREDYIHRIGRTARAGKEGEGYILVPPLEHFALDEKLRDLPLTADTSVQAANVDMTQAGNVPESVAKLLNESNRAFSRIANADKNKAYMAFLGVYGANRNKAQVITSLNRLAKFGWAMEQAPTVNPILLSKLGYKGIAGVREGAPRDSRDFGNSPRGRSSPYSDRRGGSSSYGDRRGGSSSYGDRHGGYGDRESNSRGRSRYYQ